MNLNSRNWEWFMKPFLFLLAIVVVFAELRYDILGWIIE